MTTELNRLSSYQKFKKISEKRNGWDLEVINNYDMLVFFSPGIMPENIVRQFSIELLTFKILRSWLRKFRKKYVIYHYQSKPTK